MDSYSTGEVTDYYDGTPTRIPDKVVTIHCPRRCGWFRSYTKTDQWMNQWVDHPLYGPIAESLLVTTDIRSHDCVEFRNAVIRNARKRRDNAQRA